GPCGAIRWAIYNEIHKLPQHKDRDRWLTWALDLVEGFEQPIAQPLPEPIAQPLPLPIPQPKAQPRTRTRTMNHEPDPPPVGRGGAGGVVKHAPPEDSMP